MTKNYFYIIILVSLFFAANVTAQESKQTRLQESSSIEGLSLFPNPVTGDKVYITSKSEEDKEVIVFDILGKKVLQANITSKELSVANLNPGVYLIRITEGNTSVTRKLIIK